MLINCGLLLLNLDTGSVYRRTGREELEWLGHIEDDDACPWECRDDWAVLLDRWRDAAGGGHAREAEWSYYDRLSIRGMN